MGAAVMLNGSNGEGESEGATLIRHVSIWGLRFAFGIDSHSLQVEGLGAVFCY